MPPGTIRDIRTGRAIGRTHSLSEIFADQVKNLIDQEEDFYIVHGRCRYQHMRKLVHNLRDLEYVPLVYDPQFPSDTLWIFEGYPEELGFAI